eukprot:11018664-Karenia_brevis.AAC.1
MMQVTIIKFFVSRVVLLPMRTQWQHAVTLRDVWEEEHKGTRTMVHLHQIGVAERRLIPKRMSTTALWRC